MNLILILSLTYCNNRVLKTILIIIIILICSRHTLGTLERTLARINEDLMVKTNSLNLDEQCAQVRLELSQHPSADQIINSD